MLHNPENHGMQTEEENYGEDGEERVFWAPGVWRSSDGVWHERTLSTHCKYGKAVVAAVAIKVVIWHTLLSLLPQLGADDQPAGFHFCTCMGAERVQRHKDIRYTLFVAVCKVELCLSMLKIPHFYFHKCPIFSHSLESLKQDLLCGWIKERMVDKQSSRCGWMMGLVECQKRENAHMNEQGQMWFCSQGNTDTNWRSQVASVISEDNSCRNRQDAFVITDYWKMSAMWLTGQQCGFKVFVFVTLIVIVTAWIQRP